MTSTSPPDPYKILGVSKDAQITEIRSAHRKLVLKCHPDKVQDPALKAQKQDEFQKVQQAYELLSDEKERQKYDDLAKLADLRKQAAKTNISTPRPTKYAAEFEVRTPETRPASYQSSSGVPPMSKNHSFSKSWDEDIGHGPRIFEPASRSRHQTKYTDSRPKRESDRERERDKEREKERDREKERERERDRERDRRSKKTDKSDKEDSARRAEKDARRAEKKAREARERVRDKEIKRESDEKKKHTTKPYIEEYSDESPTPKPEKKKSSSSKKFEEKQDRSAHREEAPLAARSYSDYTATPAYAEAPRIPPPAPEASWAAATDLKATFASQYIEASRVKEGLKAKDGLKRTPTYIREQPPAAPTPPPVANQNSPFAPPDDQDDARRSSARPRRGSTESSRMQRDKAYRKSSREPLDEPVLSASPTSRAQFQRASTTTGVMSGSPPHISRTNSMPQEQPYTRSMPIRSQTYSGYSEAPDSRGRNRSRLQPQIDEESDSDDYKNRKHRSSRRTRSPDQIYQEPRYYEARQGSSYSRRLDPENEQYYYTTGSRGAESRPSMPVREGSYSMSAGAAQFNNVKTSRSYGYDDAQYTHHAKPREEYAAHA
ncbi:Chaperone protein DnaJ [Cladobotryum mycophilum]|uniref:Chaperone protein DnaJ n=1 Tax=Cladobotryum mycophilum TaxID=491253 RepID=A0ABR0SUZ7_9HYPO